MVKNSIFFVYIFLLLDLTEGKPVFVGVGIARCYVGYWRKMSIDGAVLTKINII